MPLEDLSLAALEALARSHHVLLDYLDLEGTTHHVEHEPLVAVLHALGVDPEAAPGEPPSPSLERGHVHVVRRPSGDESTLVVVAPEASDLRARVTPESGEAPLELAVRPSPDGETHFVVPASLAPGYHRVALRWRARDGRRRRATGLLLLAPPSMWLPDDLRGVGLGVDLYAVRRDGDWGIGDLTSLDALVTLGARAKLAYVGVPPLHAIRGHGDDISPYSPTSRLFLNTLYLDVTAVPEWPACAAAQAWLARPEVEGALDAARGETRVDYDAVFSLKSQALTLLWHHFRDEASPSRREAFARFRAAGGDELERFAVFCALDDAMRARGLFGPDAWPRALQRPTGAAVRRFARTHRDAVDRHLWLQFEVSRQLGLVADAARRALTLGLYLDLAIGSAASGYDLWAHPDLYVRGVAAGSPPDYFNPEGQDWGLPPLNPRALTHETGCRYFASLVRANLAHAGALRIDHAAVLHRLYVVPRGFSARQGLYLKMPEEVLAAVLALESHRHETVVIGEDLGNVPDEVRRLLQGERALGYRVLLFEQRPGSHGEPQFPPSEAWAKDVLATATTHDTATLRAWFEGWDVAERVRLGLLDAGHADATRHGREREVRALVRRLHAEGLLPGGNELPTYEAFCAASHAYLARGPARLIEARLANLDEGERVPVNVPGLGQADYPSWRPRMQRSLDELNGSNAVEQGLRGIVAAR